MTTQEGDLLLQSDLEALSQVQRTGDANAKEVADILNSVYSSSAIQMHPEGNELRDILTRTVNEPQGNP